MKHFLMINIKTEIYINFKNKELKIIFENLK